MNKKKLQEQFDEYLQILEEEKIKPKKLLFVALSDHRSTIWSKKISKRDLGIIVTSILEELPEELRKLIILKVIMQSFNEPDTHDAENLH